MLKIKNWDEFQHFKDRDPIWIKVYRKLLDDLNWHELSGDDAKLLVMLWLLASENGGVLPSTKEIAFRFRLSEKSIKSSVSRLSHFLYQDDIKPISDINAISDGYQVDSPHALAERQRREETEKETERFRLFWNLYPKKIGKPAALKAWKAAHINGEFRQVLSDVENRTASADWQKEGGKYILHPTTYINQRRWEDSIDLIDSIDPFAGAVN